MSYKKNRVTIKDIAAKTGYTANTISRALKKCSDISKTTQEYIRKVADEMGYVPNIRASSLRSGDTKTIAIVYDYFVNPFYSIMTYNLDKLLSAKDYKIMIFVDINQQAILTKKVARQILSHGTSAVITFLEPEEEVVQLFKDYHIPLILLGRKGDLLSVDSVYSDDVHGGYLATKELIKSGRRKICYLGTRESVSCNKDRLEGYKLALKENDIEYEENRVCFTNIESGEEMIRKLINQNIDFDAIFCFNDMIAFEVIEYLLSHNINVPEDVSIVGFDNIQGEFKLPFRLSTIDTFKSKVVEEVCEILFNKLKDPKNDKVISKMVDVRFVKGQSTI